MRATLTLFLGLLMLGGSLFPQTDVEEVYKIPALFSHYQLHKQTAGPEFTFWQFLAMHYSPDSAHAKTPHKGVAIPCYNHLATCYVFVLTTPQVIPPALSVIRLLGKRNYFHQITYCFLQSYSLLQPPRRA